MPRFKTRLCREMYETLIDSDTIWWNAENRFTVNEFISEIASSSNPSPNFHWCKFSFGQPLRLKG